MKEEKDARRAALNIEEAALLPALPARRMDGGAALKFARRRAEQMNHMTLGTVRAWGAAERTVTKAASAPKAARAALNHVLGKSKKDGRRV